MGKSRAGLREVSCVNSGGKKNDESFIEKVRKDIQDYRNFLLEIGKL